MPAKKTFYVYDESMQDAYGRPVITNEQSGDRTIMLTDAEAKWFLTQGAIGEKPREKLKKEPAAAVDQMVGTSDPESASETTRARKASRS